MGPLTLGVGWGAAVVVVAATGAFVALALRSAWKPRRRALRAVALGAVAMGLVGIGTRPQWTRMVAGGVVLVETDGAPPAALDSLARAHRGATRVQATDSTARALEMLRDARTAAVAGYGLAEEEWSAFAGDVTFAPAEAPEGIARVFWDRAVVLGEPLVVEGNGRWSQPTLVVLTGPAGVEDSTWVSEARPAFRLSARPRDTGRLVYRLQTGPEATTGEIGTAVVAPPSRRVLILEHRPRFATRHLKEWLGARGDAVMIRTRISRNRFRTEFVNQSRVTLDRVDAGALDGLDAVVADAASLAALSVRERGALRRAIERDGTGLLVRPDRSSEVAWEDELLEDFVVVRDPDLDDLTATPRWIGLEADSLPAVPAVARAVTPGIAARPIVWDGSDRAMAAVARRGSGHVVVSLVAEPERWRLRGRDDAFADYWAHVLGAATAGRATDRWNLTPDGPVFPHMTVVFDLVTASVQPLTTVTTPSGREDPLPLAQDTVNASRWRGLYRPRETGWHVARSEHGAFAFHVTARDGWAAWDAARRLDATARRAAAPAGSDRPTRAAALPIPLFWFWLAVVTGAGYLWAEGKLSP